MYTELRCDIRAKTQKVAAYKNIMYAGFSEERCPVQETGRHGHCTEYRKKTFLLGGKFAYLTLQIRPNECAVTACRAEVQ